MAVDSWDNATLGDLLGDNVGSYMKALTDYKNQLVDQLNKVNATLGVIQGRVNTVTSFLNTTDTILSSLLATGFYIVYMSPGTGNWATRLPALPGAPDQLGFSAGLCAIAKGPNLSDVQTKYDQMILALTTPLPF